MVYNKWYILPIGWLCITYHLLREPETAIDHCTWILRHAQKSFVITVLRLSFFKTFYKEWILRQRPLLRKGTANSEFSHSQNLIYSDFINALVFQIPPEVWCFRYDFWGPNTSSPGALKPRDRSIMWDHVSSPDSWLSIPMVIFNWWWNPKW